MGEVMSISLIPKEIQIQEILENFDFEKVHKVMAFLKWKWACGYDFEGKPVYVTPTEKELVLSALERLNRVWDEYHSIATKENYDCFIISGGFNTTITKFGTLKLEFVLEEYFIEDEESY